VLGQQVGQRDPRQPGGGLREKPAAIEQPAAGVRKNRRFLAPTRGHVWNRYQGIKG
jgi:hypothetical protein